MRWHFPFARDERGAALPMVALAMFVLVGVTGIAIDMSRVQIAQSRISNALDAAGLAAGASINANATTVAQNFFYANYPATYLHSTVHDFTVAVSADTYTINLSVKADVPMTFMRLFGKNSVTVSAKSQITRASKGMELVLILDNTGSMNCDISNPNATCSGGSTSKIAALRSAAAQMLNILYGSTNNTVENLWVGIVPFSQTVNIGKNYPTWMDTAFDASLDYGPAINNKVCSIYTVTNPDTSGTYSSTPSCTYKITTSTNTLSITNFGMTNWAGCVMARTSPYDVSDDAPSVKKFQAYDYPESSTNSTDYDNWKTYPSSTTQNCTGSGSHKTCTYSTSTVYNYSLDNSLGAYQGPNVFCPQPVTPMVAEKNTLVTAINSMTAGGSTFIDLGMAWGWRMLSPNWRGLWGGEMNSNSLPLNYNTPLMNKVVILMTDGMNSVSTANYTAYGWLADKQLGTTSVNTANSTLDTRTLSACTQMKNNGIIIYTIGFGTNDDNDPNDTTSVNGPLLKACATKPEYYFLAPTNAQLQSAFQQIGNALANLRVSQ